MGTGIPFCFHYDTRYPVYKLLDRDSQHAGNLCDRRHENRECQLESIRASRSHTRRYVLRWEGHYQLPVQCSHGLHIQGFRLRHLSRKSRENNKTICSGPKRVLRLRFKRIRRQSIFPPQPFRYGRNYRRIKIKKLQRSAN